MTDPPPARGNSSLRRSPLRLEITPRAPGFSLLKVDFFLPDDRKIYARAGLMTAPGEVQPGAPEPADFDAFWEAQKTAVRAEPMQPTERRLEADPAEKFEVWDITVPTPGTRPVRACLTKPGRSAGAQISGARHLACGRSPQRDQTVPFC